ncbi:MAG: hypothetical protein KO464_03575 [Candidatus Methanofastidiosum sp.]|nr:hypothetical protein [Methanofastidiosum sp.]
MKKQIVLILSGLILISLFSGCLEESIVEIYNDHLEGCKWEYVIYEPYFDEECYSDCSQELQFIQQQGCQAYCRDENNGYQDCLTQCRVLENSLHIVSNSEDICQEECMIASPKPITLGQSIPVPRCSTNGLAPIIFSGPVGCIDVRNCPAEGDCTPKISFDCTLPNNYNCQIVHEQYSLKVYYSGSGTIYVNGVPFQANGILFGKYIEIYFYDQENGQYMNSIKGIPSSITITADEGFDPNEFGITLERQCCYECRQKSIPAAILYPNVDIENFQIVGGDTIIQDGKTISSFNISPGTQQTKIQIENRGFFTQNDVRVRFDGLPEGIIVGIEPGLQKIKAHNIGSYDATFTVGPNVSSGRYPVVMTAFSLNGTFDRIVVEIVVP